MADTPTATAPQQDQGFDPLGELRKRYPGISQEPDEKLYQHLSNPANFRSAFPEYQHLDDETITRNMTSHAPTEAARQGIAKPFPAAAAMVPQTETQFEKEKTPAPEDTGFWGRVKQFGRDIGGMAAGLPAAIPGGKTVSDIATGNFKDVPMDVLPGGDTVRGLSEAAKSDVERQKEGRSPAYRALAAGAQASGIANPAPMEEAARRGDPTGVMVHAAAQAAPVVAPVIAEGALRVAKPLGSPISTAVSRVAESAPGKAITEIPKKLAEPFGVGVTGERMMKQGIAPHAKQLGYDAAVKTLGDDIVSYHKETPIKTVKDLGEALPEIKKGIEEKDFKPTMERHAKEQLAPERAARVKQAVLDSVSPFAEEFDEASTKKVGELAEKMGKTRMIGEVMGGNRGGLLGYINGQLESYFQKYPSARRSDLMKNPDTAAWEAARRSLREETLSQLEDGGEAGIREARQRWGAAEELSRAVERRINQGDRLKPIGIGKAIGLAAAPKTLGLSYVLGSIADYLNKPDTLVGRGIEKMAAKPLNGKSLPVSEAPKAAPAAVPLSKRPPTEIYQRPIEAAPGAGKGAAPHEMHPDELAAIRKEAGDPNMTPEEAHRYRINKTARTAAAAKPLNDLGGMKRAGD